MYGLEFFGWQTCMAACSCVEHAGEAAAASRPCHRAVWSRAELQASFGTASRKARAALGGTEGRSLSSAWAAIQVRSVECAHTHKTRQDNTRQGKNITLCQPAWLIRYVIPHQGQLSKVFAHTEQQQRKVLLGVPLLRVAAAYGNAGNAVQQLS